MTNCPLISNSSADNGYSTDENITYLEEKGLDGYIYPPENSQEKKKYNLWENHFKRQFLLRCRN